MTHGIYLYGIGFSHESWFSIDLSKLYLINRSLLKIIIAEECLSLEVIPRLVLLSGSCN